MISLTPLTLSHANDIFNSVTGNVASYFYDFKTIEETEEWVRDAILKHALGNKKEYIIAEDRFIGMISPSFITPDEVEIGMWIAPAEQGKGYGKAALLLMLEILEEEGVSKVHYITDKDNLPSIHLATSLDFIPTTEHEEIHFIKDLKVSNTSPFTYFRI